MITSLALNSPQWIFASFSENAVCKTRCVNTIAVYHIPLFALRAACYVFSVPFHAFLQESGWFGFWSVQYGGVHSGYAVCTDTLQGDQQRNLVHNQPWSPLHWGLVDESVKHNQGFQIWQHTESMRSVNVWCNGDLGLTQVFQSLHLWLTNRMGPMKSRDAPSDESEIWSSCGRSWEREECSCPSLASIDSNPGASKMNSFASRSRLATTLNCFPPASSETWSLTAACGDIIWG